MFIFEGEAAISVGSKTPKNVIKMGAGSAVAEECAILGIRSKWTIRVSSEFLLLGSISK